MFKQKHFFQGFHTLIEVWFYDKNSMLLDVKDRKHLTRVINYMGYPFEPNVNYVKVHG